MHGAWLQYVSMSLAIMAWHVASSIVHTVCCVSYIDSVCVNVNLRALFQLCRDTRHSSPHRDTPLTAVSISRRSIAEKQTTEQQGPPPPRRGRPLSRETACVCVWRACASYGTGPMDVKDTGQILSGFFILAPLKSATSGSRSSLMLLAARHQGRVVSPPHAAPTPDAHRTHTEPPRSGNT